MRFHPLHIIFDLHFARITDQLPQRGSNFSYKHCRAFGTPNKSYPEIKDVVKFICQFPSSVAQQLTKTNQMSVYKRT